MPEKNLTITAIAEKYDRDRSTVLRWIEQKVFPNARLEESPAGSYWTVPAKDLNGFSAPRRGPKTGKPTKRRAKT